MVSRDSKVDNFAIFFFFFPFVDYYNLVFWPRLDDPSICQSLIGVYVRHFLGQCWVVHKPFVRMVKFKFLSHVLVDHLADPVVSSLILHLC